MAFNPSPEVRAAAEFAKRFGADRVIIYYTTPAGEYGYSSYGRTSKLCASAKRIADRIWDAVSDALGEE
jgi:hypothetical protein